MKLWELDKNKKYEGICGIIACDEYGWYVEIDCAGTKIGKDAPYSQIQDKYNWIHIEEMDFNEYNPSRLSNKLAVYRNKNNGSISFKLCDGGGAIYGPAIEHIGYLDVTKFKGE